MEIQPTEETTEEPDDVMYLTLNKKQTKILEDLLYHHSDTPMKSYSDSDTAYIMRCIKIYEADKKNK